MNLYSKIKPIAILLILISLAGCKSTQSAKETENIALPETYLAKNDTLNSATIKWNSFFTDQNLNSLIEIGLKNNVDLQITLQDIEIAKNDVRIKKGLLLPTVSGFAAAGVEKAGLYTSQGAGDASTEITPGREVPENLNDYKFGLHTVWEIDIWKKLRNSKKAALSHYLATVEGKNFVTTGLVAEIANSYYELLALDNQLDVINETIALQKNAYEIVKVQKQAAVVTELAVQKYEAEVLNSESMQFEIKQQIVETENRINFLLGRFPQPIVRDKSVFASGIPASLNEGIPSQLLSNRPDIKQASLELMAAKCDVKAAKAEFYPSFTINAGIGFQAFNPSYLLKTPESLIYNLVGDLTAPLLNRNAIKAEFNKAEARKIQAMYDYQKSILNGYVEVANELSNFKNLKERYELKNKEVNALNNSIAISNDLFKSNRVDYFEVLMTQRDAISSKLELIEAKKKQYSCVVNLYKSLGGGWK